MKIYKAFLKDGKPVIESYKVSHSEYSGNSSIYLLSCGEFIADTDLDRFNRKDRVVYSLIESRAIEIFERYEPFYF